ATCFDRSWPIAATVANHGHRRSIPRSGAELANRLLRNTHHRGAAIYYKTRSSGLVPFSHRGRRLVLFGRRCDLRARGTRRFLEDVPPPPRVESWRRD